MRSSVRPEWVGGAAGVALIVLVFLPWWELDAGSLQQTSPESAPSDQVLGYLDLFSVGDTTASPWDATPRTAAVWIVTGLAAIALAGAAAGTLGKFARRGLAAGATLAGSIAFGIALLRVIDPPLESFTPMAWGYAGVAAAAAIAGAAALTLRQA